MRTTLGFLIAGVAFAQTGIQKTGAVALVRTESKFAAGPLGSIENTTDNFAALFETTDFTNYTPGQIPPTTVIGPCTVVVVNGPSPTTGTQAVVTPLDAGPVMNVNGPNGSKQFAAITPGLYGGTLGGGIAIPIPGAPPVAPLYLDPGTYTVDNGGGGADIGPFMATLTLPSPTFTWTNADADVMIDRTVGVDVQWAGGDPNVKVLIQGVSSANDPASGLLTAAIFICTVDNTGDFFVTPDVLSLLPATPGGGMPAASALTVTSAVQASFNATGSDMSAITFQSGSSRGVVYQ